ncbi:hypothetical protein [Ferruginibacter sp.]|uniref:hypothetical protein n=1 Tax=Ferruginibacter sp. TaxID=1940288 RepID=UPI0019A9FD89|nr:hypothetical protein [Ferruginibacter sp.]MBC7628095.1 hypothetical protein [Ferruginibacter sp.]
MKHCLIILSFFINLQAYSQVLNFKTDVATAKSAYASGKLEDAHFALQQSMQEIDIIIGKEVLKLLPLKMDTLAAVTAQDNVTGNISFVGATIHRSYGKGIQKADVEIVNNSPLLGMLNAFLTSPLLAGLGNDGKTKVLKIQGYKSRLTKEDNAGGSPSYRLEIPFSNALVTLNVNNSTDTEIIAMASSIPFDQIAKLIQ